MTPGTRGKLVATAWAVTALGIGMVFLAAIAAPKFGTFSGGLPGYSLDRDLRDLRDAELAYRAAYDHFLEVEPVPATAAEEGTWPEPVPFVDLAWRPAGPRIGRYWVTVDPDGEDFAAHCKIGDVHYVVHARDTPTRVRVSNPP